MKNIFFLHVISCLTPNFSALLKKKTWLQKSLAQRRLMSSELQLQSLNFKRQSDLKIVTSVKYFPGSFSVPKIYD